jgi:hypothetical protein
LFGILYKYENFANAFKNSKLDHKNVRINYLSKYSKDCQDICPVLIFTIRLSMSAVSYDEMVSIVCIKKISLKRLITIYKDILSIIMQSVI